MSGPTDVRGRPIGPGDFVCYTTNAEGSTLQFGTIESIIDKGRPLKVVILKTDSFGRTTYDWYYDSVTGQRVSIDKPLKSGRIDYSERKFLKL